MLLVFSGAALIPGLLSAYRAIGAVQSFITKITSDEANDLFSCLMTAIPACFFLSVSVSLLLTSIAMRYSNPKRCKEGADEQ